MPAIRVPSCARASVRNGPPVPIERTSLASIGSTALVVVLVLAVASPATAGPYLDIGSVATFAAGGEFTLGDKDFRYLDDSGNWTGIEDIQLTANADPDVLSHQFLIDHLAGYSSPITLVLGYQVHINGTGFAQYFRDVFLDAIVSTGTVDVWKDVYASQDDYDAKTAPGSGTWALYSLDGSTDFEVFPIGLTDLWVRDTIKLTGAGQVSSVANTFRQSVPEIDPQAIGGGLALVLGALALLERRFRRAPAYAGAC